MSKREGTLYNFFPKNRRALSAVIITLIMIALALVLVAVVWVVVSNLIKGQTEGISLEKLTFDAEIREVGIDNSTNNLTLGIQRKAGQGEITGMKFVFENDTEKEISTSYFTLVELGTKRFEFHLLMDVSSISKISIVPLFESSSGEETIGNVVDSYSFRGGESGSYSPPVPCAPNCTGKECGNDGCDGSCGTCSSGFTCNVTGQCAADSCDLTSASWSQTSVVNGTLVTMSAIGSGCSGVALNYSIWEDDLIIDDFIVSINGNYGNSTTWTAIWTYIASQYYIGSPEYDDDDLGTDPRTYYFKVRVLGESEEVTSSNTLSVSQAGATCTPTTCAALGYNCGTWTNGTCSGTLNCGNCSTGYSCVSGTCVSSCTPTTCAALGYECGTAANGTCSGTLSCGNCTLLYGVGYTCNSSGQCVSSCTPTTCAALGYECGTAANGTCAGTLNCGTCSSGYSCVGGTCVEIIPSSTIIIDHNSVDLYDDIPAYYINEIKKDWLNVLGESHSSGYRIGADLLSQLDPNYAVDVTHDWVEPPQYTEEMLRVNGIYRNIYGWRTGIGEEDWYTGYVNSDFSVNEAGLDLIKYDLDYFSGYDEIYGNITAVGFGWCWDMTWHNGVGGGVDPVYNTRWAGSSVGGPEGDLRWGLDDADYALTGNPVSMDTYLEATQAYINYAESQDYETIVFFTTGPVDGNCNTESGYQREIKQQYIRDYVATNGGVLFDYADILTHNNGGELNTCSWNGNSYPHIHSDNMMDYDGSWNIISYTEDGDHIGEVGALRLGKALWVMMARLEGWDGVST